jgi:hypothetical protein
MKTTKTITVYATNRANIEPGRKGYILSIADPDADSAKPLSERTFASGYAVPLNVEIPADWEVAEAKDGMTYLWAGDTAMQLAWYHNKGTVAAWPAFATFDEAKGRGALTTLKAQKLSAVA